MTPLVSAVPQDAKGFGGVKPTSLIPHPHIQSATRDQGMESLPKQPFSQFIQLVPTWDFWTALCPQPKPPAFHSSLCLGALSSSFTAGKLLLQPVDSPP